MPATEKTWAGIEESTLSVAAVVLSSMTVAAVVAAIVSSMTVVADLPAMTVVADLPVMIKAVIVPAIIVFPVEQRVYHLCYLLIRKEDLWQIIATIFCIADSFH